MKKYRMLMPLLALVTMACTAGNKNQKQEVQTARVYENEFFSLKYPNHWTYEEEINNMNDTVPALTKGVRVTFYDPSESAPWLTVAVQKSAMPDIYGSAEKWRDFSNATKSFDPHYLVVIDELQKDSLSFKGYPAAMTGYIVDAEQGDTVIHKQILVLVDDEVFYINNTFDWNDDGTLEHLGDSLISTVSFKK
jgi:hypothetical protein